MLGRIIGNYQITGELAQGGMGAVYRGRHQSLPREVVVKSILLSSFPAHAQDQLKARFVREAYVQSQLDHQNIVRVYEFFTFAENYYLVMEFVDGMSLRDLIKRQGAMAPANAIPLFKQALAALDYAHNYNYMDESGARHAGIIHRDIKPANLLLDGMARLKITDFGIVKLAGERGMTRTGFNPGTVEYMSPEQIRGLEVDARSDLYSLGVTFYEALTGRLPFPHSDTGSEYEVLKGHMELAPPPIAAVRPETPPALSALVMRALEKDPNARFRSAAEFLQALLDCEQSGGSMREEVARAASKPPHVTHSMTEVISYDTRPAPITATTPPRTVQPSRAAQVMEPALAERGAAAQPRRYGLLVAGAIFVLLAAGAGAFLYFKQNGAPSSAASSTAMGASTTTPASAAPQEDERLRKAREAEAEERYYDAIILYGEYLVDHALDTSPGIKKVQDHKTELEDFFGLISMGDFEMNMRNYAEAKRNFSDALKLRPESKVAQNGLAKAESHLAGAR